MGAGAGWGTLRWLGQAMAEVLGTAAVMLVAAWQMPGQLVACLMAMTAGTLFWWWRGRGSVRRRLAWLPLILLGGLMFGSLVPVTRDALVAGVTPDPFRVEDLGGDRRGVPWRVRLSGYAPRSLAYKVHWTTDHGGRKKRRGTPIHHEAPWQGFVGEGWQEGQGVTVLIDKAIPGWQRSGRIEVEGVLYAVSPRRGDWPMPDMWDRIGVDQVPFPLAPEAYVLLTRRDADGMSGQWQSMAAAFAVLSLTWVGLVWYIRKNIAGEKAAAPPVPVDDRER